MTYDGIPSTSSDSATTSKRKKNCRDTFKFQMGKTIYLSKRRMMHCFGISKKLGIALMPLKAILNHEVDRLSIQHLEYEMERIDLPDY